MSNPRKRKGTAHESDGRDALQDAGIIAYRPAQSGHKDIGDVVTPDYPIAWQFKNYANVADGVREGVDGAIVQAHNAGKDFGVAVVKRPRRNIRDAYVVMRFQDFVRLIKLLFDK